MGTSVGENIKTKRLKKKLTQKELAEIIKVSPSMVCQIERGTKTPSILLGKDIAEALDCILDDLV